MSTLPLRHLNKSPVRQIIKEAPGLSFGSFNFTPLSSYSHCSVSYSVQSLRPVPLTCLNCGSGFHRRNMACPLGSQFHRTPFQRDPYHRHTGSRSVVPRRQKGLSVSPRSRKSVLGVTGPSLRTGSQSGYLLRTRHLCGAPKFDQTPLGDNLCVRLTNVSWRNRALPAMNVVGFNYS